MRWLNVRYPGRRGRRRSGPDREEVDLSAIAPVLGGIVVVNPLFTLVVPVWLIIDLASGAIYKRAEQDELDMPDEMLDELPNSATPSQDLLADTGLPAEDNAPAPSEDGAEDPTTEPIEVDGRLGEVAAVPVCTTAADLQLTARPEDLASRARELSRHIADCAACVAALTRETDVSERVVLQGGKGLRLRGRHRVYLTAAASVAVERARRP